MAGSVRWLRLDCENPAGRAVAAKGQQVELDVGAVAVEAADKAPWPKALPEQVARQFRRARAASVKPLLESLGARAQPCLIEGGRFAA